MTNPIIEKRDLYKGILQSALDGFWIVDREGNILEVNDAYCKMSGYTREELTNMKVFQVEALEEPDEMETRIQSIIREGSVKFESKHMRKDGTVFEIETSIQYLPKDEGIFVGFISDITQRNVMLRQLKENELFLEETQTIGRLGTFKIDVSSGNWESSGILDSILGIDESYERNAEGLVKLVHPDFVKDLQDYYATEVVETRVFEKEHKIICPFDNSEKWVYTRAVLNLSSDDSSNEMIGIVRDISEMKSREDELQAARLKAEESDRMKSSFLANISHEIRTPINGIIGFIDLIKETTLHEEDIAKYLTIIRNSSDRVVNLMSKIVAFARIDSEVPDLKISNIRLDEEIKRISESFIAEAEEKGLRLIINKEAVSRNDITISSDRELLRSILDNLVDNAIKFSHKGKVEIDYELRDQSVRIYVRDQGIGIPANQLDRIFERFYQVDSSLSRIYEGSGLGLSLSKAYAELLGGNITVDSQPGKGSTFVLILPQNP